MLFQQDFLVHGVAVIVTLTVTSLRARIDVDADPIPLTEQPNMILTHSTRTGAYRPDTVSPHQSHQHQPYSPTKPYHAIGLTNRRRC